VVCGSSAQAQGKTVADGIPLVTADPASGTFDRNLPFDQPFLISVPYPQNTQSLRIAFGGMVLDVTQGEGGIVSTTPRIGVPIVSRTVTAPVLDTKTTGVFIPALHAGESYLLTLDYVVGSNTTHVQVLGRSLGAFKDHFREDFGLGWSPPPGPAYVAGGSNIHLYFVPINEAGGSGSFSKLDFVLKRFSVFAGLTVFDLRTGRPIDKVFSPGNPQTGIGFRPLSSGLPMVFNMVYLNFGLVYFDQKDPNPLITKEHGKHAPFVGLAGTVDFKDVLGPLAVLIGGGK
jgi:hypothetical protein